MIPTTAGLLFPGLDLRHSPQDVAEGEAYALLESGAEGVEVTAEGVLIQGEALRRVGAEGRVRQEILARLGLAGWPGKLSLCDEGLVGNPRYRIHLRWSEDGAEQVGPFLQGGRWWLLSAELEEAGRIAAEAAGKSKVEVLRAITRLQALQRRGAPLCLQGNLGKRRVMLATRLRIRLSPDPLSGAPIPEPVLVSPEGEELALTPEQVDQVSGGALLGEAAIPVKLGEFVISGPQVARAALITRLAATAPPAERQRFIADPIPFFADAEERADFFDEEDYSARVIGVGAAPSPTVRPPTEARDWVSADQPLSIEIPTLDGGSISVALEELPQLCAAIAQSAAQGKSSVQWRSGQIAADPRIAAALTQLRNEGQPEESRRSNVVILQIYANEIVLDWSPPRRPRAGNPDLPPLRRQLRAHQLVGLARLQTRWRHGEAGALLCDDMGLGKTTQALVFAAWAAAQRPRRLGPDDPAEAVDVPVAVVAPRSLLMGWLREIATVLGDEVFPSLLWGQRTAMPNAKGRSISPLHTHLSRKGEGQVVFEDARIDLDGLRRKRPDVLLIAYDTLRVWQHALGKLKIGVLIADEAQEVKEPSSLRSHALRAMRYDFGLALTGTPVENSWTDLWTLADFSVPGFLGTLSQFRRIYPEQGDVIQTGARLAARMADPLIRRLRGDVLADLPPCTVRQAEALMPPLQQARYLAACGDQKGRGGILPLLQSLASTSLHPRQRAALHTASEAATWLKESARTQVMLDWLLRWRPEGGVVLLFVRSRAMQETLSKALSLYFDLGAVPVLNGTADERRRQEIVDQAAAGQGFRLLILSPDVGGAGWNLQFSNRSVLLERPYNPAVEDQIIARTWRMGQPNPVDVVLPIALLPSRRSYDVVLAELLEGKRALASGVLAPHRETDLEARLGELLS